jgi:AraC-like DNA-binding protein
MHKPTIHINLCDFHDRKRLEDVAKVLGAYGPVTIATANEDRLHSASLEVPSFGVFVMYAHEPMTRKILQAAIRCAGARYFTHSFFIFVGPSNFAFKMASAMLGPHQSFTWIDESAAFSKLLQQLKGEFRLLRKEITEIVKAYQTNKALSRKREEAQSFERQLKRVIKVNYQNPNLKTSDISDALGMSVSTLERKTLQQFDRLPKQLLTDYRLKKVRDALENSNKSIQAIALKVGFNSGQYMSVRFQEIFGVQPSVYRQLYQRKIAS